MKSRGFLGEEVPCRVVGSGRLWDLVVRSRLDRVNEIRELDCILDEENRDVIPDNVKVALVGVESDCESVNITSSVRTSPGAGDSREADKYWSLLILRPQKRRSSNVAKVPVAGKRSMGAGASSMDCSFRNSFVVKVRNFLSEYEVLQQSWTALSSL
uniref:Uncharacterized protein n=1 Tax=Photinus pyralis TaxID=7054 RepID=A0A1Y1LA22_PHOPY